MRRTQLDSAILVTGVDGTRDVRKVLDADFDRPVDEEYEAMLEAENLDTINIVTPHTSTTSRRNGLSSRICTCS